MVNVRVDDNFYHDLEEIRESLGLNRSDMYRALLRCGIERLKKAVNEMQPERPISGDSLGPELPCSRDPRSSGPRQEAQIRCVSGELQGPHVHWDVRSLTSSPRP